MSFYNYAPPPAGKRTAYWAGFAAAVVMLVGLVGLAGRVVSGDDADPATGPSSDASSAPQSPSPTDATPSASGDPTQAGSEGPTDGPSTAEPGTGPTGLVGEALAGDPFTVTVQRAERVTAPQERRPEAGKAWFGVRAEVCTAAAGPGATTDLAWSTAWRVVTSAGVAYPGSDVEFTDYPPQQLPTAAPEAGQCSVGWTLIAIDKSEIADAVAVVFAPGSATPMTWTVV
jgi:hypothetical protein